ncbi:MAG: hypothetical protein V7642_320 [Burkholderiales bacterium]|jgi:hypothetical protein
MSRRFLVINARMIERKDGRVFPVDWSKNSIG